MPVCWFCGTDFDNLQLCPQCQQNYCYYHYEPLNHDCPGESIQNPYKIDTSSILDSLPAYDYSKMKPLSPFMEYEAPPLKDLYQCWHCGLNFNDAFFCGKCSQYFCIRHKEPADHNCLDLIDTIKQNLEQETPNYLDQSMERELSPVDEISQEGARINLDPRIVDKSSSLRFIEDASYLDMVEAGSDIITEREITIKVVIKDNIVINRSTLTYITEHARKSGKLECFGLVSGERLQDGTISKITGNVPLALGTSTFVNPDFRIFNTVLQKFENRKDTIVGWYHSHPGPGAPTFSWGDRESHKMFRTFFGYNDLFNSVRCDVSKSNLINLIMVISRFSFPERSYLLKVIYSILNRTRILTEINNHIARVLKSCYQQIGIDPLRPSITNNDDMKKILLDLPSCLSSSFPNLKNIIDKTIKRNKIRLLPLPFKDIPLAGFIVCPEMKKIAIMDCNQEINPMNSNKIKVSWLYYRIRVNNE